MPMIRFSRAVSCAERAHFTSYFWVAALLLITIEALVWSWGGSGVSRIRFFFVYPEGFNYVIDDAIVGRFTVQREDFRYIAQYFSFLRNDAFGLVQDWPAQRNIYALLVSGLWPLGFVVGGVVVNLFSWVAAAICAWKMTELVGATSLLARSSAVLFVVFHQGFLWSVGETNPHAAGYASGFLILGAIAHQRALLDESRMRDLVPIAALTGILCLFYHTASLYIPLVLFVFCRKFWQQVRSAREPAMPALTAVAILAALTIGPSVLFSELLTWLGLLHRQSSTAGYYLHLLSTFLDETPNAMSATFFAFLGGFNSFGPLLQLPMLIGALKSIQTGDWGRRAVVLYFLAVMVALIPNFLAGTPGYASTNLAPLAILLAVIGLESIYDFVRKRSTRIATAAAFFYVGGLAAYVNAPLFGVPYPLNIGWTGYYCFLECPPIYSTHVYDYIEEIF